MAGALNSAFCGLGATSVAHMETALQWAKRLFAFNADAIQTWESLQEYKQTRFGMEKRT